MLQMNKGYAGKAEHELERVTMPLTRRGFLAMGSAAVAACGGTVQARIAGVARPPALIMIDGADLRAVDLGTAWAKNVGARPIYFYGDMSRAWLDHLHGQWNKFDAPVGGMTSSTQLYCFERLAWDVGRRVTGRIQLPTPEGSEPRWRWLITPRTILPSREIDI